MEFTKELGYAIAKADELVTAIRIVQDLTVPSTPQSVTAAGAGSTATVTWQPSIGARGVANYKVYQDGVLVSSPVSSPAAISGLVSGTYVFSVSAVDGQGHEGAKGYASSLVISVGPPLPDSPVNFVASNVSPTQNDLTWADGPIGGATTDYDLDFSTSGTGGPWTSLSIGLQLSYSHTGLSVGTYTYRIKAKNVSGDSAYAFATATIAVSVSATTYGLSTDLTTTASWRSTTDVITGWDWSYPPSHIPAPFSGMFMFTNAVNDWPANFPGNKIYKINANWVDLEPTRNTARTNAGTYDLSELDLLSTLSSSWDGIQLDVRGAVFSGEGVTAPDWLATGNANWKYTGTTHNGTGGASGGAFQYYDIGDSDWSTPFRLLIDAIAAYQPPSWQGTTYTVPNHPRLITQIVHGQSPSDGEEADLGQNPTGPDGHVRTCQIWAQEYGANSYKLGWCGEGRTQSDNDSITAAGLGSRGGAIENFLQSEYTPYRSDSTVTPNRTKIGQSVTPYLNSAGVTASANYYLVVDETYPVIANYRHFGDQNEFWKQTEIGDAYPAKGSHPERWTLGYTGATLRAIQMRRNVLAIETLGSFRNNTGATAINGSEGFVNPSLVKWASLQLGKRLDGMGGSNAQAREAWVWLMQTWSRSYVNSTLQNIAVHNFEHYMVQREALGGTTLTQLEDWGWHPTNIDNSAVFAEALHRIYRARQMSSSTTGMGFSLDDRFTTGTTSVAIKVVYIDNNTQTWTLEYKNSSAQTLSVANTNTNSGLVKTRTFFLTDFYPQSGTAADFRLKGSTTTPFMFVRIIKL